jgi:hypothetical protein
MVSPAGIFSAGDFLFKQPISAEFQIQKKTQQQNGYRKSLLLVPEK